jgi:predicted choloylglycine hydrolase
VTLVSAAIVLTATGGRACTIVVLRDEERVLFCGNEDWINPRTQVWFEPYANGGGSVFVGYSDGFAQAGMNDHGLAFDYVAGFDETWSRNPTATDLEPSRAATLMLETCSTVVEAIDFFRTHNHRALAEVKMMVADRSGTSAIIGFKNGELEVVESKECRAFGVNEKAAARMLDRDRTATLENARRILRASVQRQLFGVMGTQYSTVFDLSAGEVFIYQFWIQAEPVHFRLRDRLSKGAHRVSNATPITPYLVVSAFTLMPSLVLLLVATVARRWRGWSLASGSLAVMWLLAADALALWIDLNGMGNSLSRLPLCLTAVAALAAIAVLVRLHRKRNGCLVSSAKLLGSARNEADVA